MKRSVIVNELELKDELIDVEVTYDYTYDAGYWMDSNGEGLPPSESWDVIEIKNIDTGELIKFSDITKSQWSYIEDEIANNN